MQGKAVNGPHVPTILVVDDEPQVRHLLRQGLEAAGYLVAEAGDKESMISVLETVPVKLITLDLNLGRLDGLELAREIRISHNVPIIMITGRNQPLDRVIGLEHGADDYITKPFLIREVVIRVRNLLSRYMTAIDFPPIAKQRFVFEGFVLDAKARELRSSTGTPIDLTETELRLAELFVRNPARVLSRDEIWQVLRGHDWSPLDRTLDGHVARLRRKIEPMDEEEPRLIKSVRGVGYVFTADVQ